MIALSELEDATETATSFAETSTLIHAVSGALQQAAAQARFVQTVSAFTDCYFNQ